VDGYADHLIEGHVGEGEGHVVDAVLDVGKGKASDRRDFEGYQDSRRVCD